MTYRERREARAERYREWAGQREERAATSWASRESLRGDWALTTQPGHIPARERLIARDDRDLASVRKAESMRSRADEIERQADRAIYSDDPDAVEQLERRIAILEAERERIKAFNASCRKGECDESILTDAERRSFRSTLKVAAWQMTDAKGRVKGFPAYHLSNLNGNITRQRQRLEQLRRQQQRSERASAAPGGVTISGKEWVTVTFAEKPDRETINALKAAGFRWGGGSWHGRRAALPSELTAGATAEPVALDWEEAPGGLQGAAFPEHRPAAPEQLGLMRERMDEPMEGYRNAATFHTSLLIDNERDLYFAMRDLLKRAGSPAAAAPRLRRLVVDTLAGRNRLLSAEERRVWTQEIRDNGGLGAVDWQQLAESEMDIGSGIVRFHEWGLSRTRARHGGRARPRTDAGPTTQRPTWYKRMVEGDQSPDVCEVCEERVADPVLSRRTRLTICRDCYDSGVADGIIDRDGHFLDAGHPRARHSRGNGGALALGALVLGGGALLLVVATHGGSETMGGGLGGGTTPQRRNPAALPKPTMRPRLLPPPSTVRHPHAQQQMPPERRRHRGWVPTGIAQGFLADAEAVASYQQHARGS